MVWPTLGSRTAKEQNRVAVMSVITKLVLDRIKQCWMRPIATEVVT